MQEKTQVKPELFYSENVDVMFTTYKKELLKNISRLGNNLMISAGVESESYEPTINLINLLNNQLHAVNAFISEYCKINETK